MGERNRVGYPTVRDFSFSAVLGLQIEDDMIEEMQGLRDYFHSR